MQHHHLVLLTVGAVVHDAEALRQVQVHLNGRTLPLASERVLELDVDLGRVERTAALVHFVRQPAALECLAQRLGGEVPLFVGPEILVGRSGRQVAGVLVAELLQQRVHQVEDAGDLVGQLLAGAEDVRVVLGEAAHALHAVQHARALVAVDGAELGIADRQLAIAVLARLIDEDVPGAVHRLGAVGLAVDVHRRVHDVAVVLQVPRDLVELLARDVRGIHELVAVLEMLFLPEGLDLVAHHAALGVPQDQPGPDALVHRVEVEFLAETAMVALERLLDVLQVRLEIGLARERGAVNALQHLVAFAAEPVGAGDVGDLERADLAGVRQVRPAAQIHEVAVGVVGHLGIGRDHRQEVELVLLVGGGESSLRLVAGGFAGHERLLLGDDLAHARLDLLQVLGSERRGAREVVVKAVLDRRSAGDLDVREQVDDRGGEHVGRRMAQPVERFTARVVGDFGTIGCGCHGHGGPSWADAGIRGRVRDRGTDTVSRRLYRRGRWWALLDLNQ